MESKRWINKYAYKSLLTDSYYSLVLRSHSIFKAQMLRTLYNWAPRPWGVGPELNQSMVPVFGLDWYKSDLNLGWVGSVPQLESMPWNEVRVEGFIGRDGRCGGRCSGMWLVKTLSRKNCQDFQNDRVCLIGTVTWPSPGPCPAWISCGCKCS